MKESGHSHEKLLESYSCRGRVAQLGEHLLCKHAVISPKSLNRRLLTVQTPLLVGLLTGLHTIQGTLSKFRQILRTWPGPSREYPGHFSIIYYSLREDPGTHLWIGEGT